MTSVLTEFDRQLLLNEEGDLLEQLEPGALDDLDILVRSAHRRAIRARLNEIRDELSDDELTREGQALALGGLA